MITATTPSDTRSRTKPDDPPRLSRQKTAASSTIPSPAHTLAETTENTMIADQPLQPETKFSKSTR